MFKLNYLPKANVKDITDISFEEDVSNLEVDCTAFADVTLNAAPATNPSAGAAQQTKGTK